MIFSARVLRSLDVVHHKTTHRMIEALAKVVITPRSHLNRIIIMATIGIDQKQLN